MQNISEISTLLLAIFLGSVLIGVRGEFLENVNKIQRPVLLVVAGEVAAELEYHGQRLAGR